MRLLNSVYVAEHRASIRTSKGSLLISGERGTTRVPLEGIDSVVILGGASMTVDAISACADRRVRVSVHQRSGKLKWSASTPTSGNVNLRLLQYQLAQPGADRLDLCRHLVAGKLQNSRRIVHRWARDATGLDRRRLERRAGTIGDRVGRLLSAPTEDHVRGIEGDAARTFFSAAGIVLSTTEFPFTERSRRPPRDPVNAAMSFAYAMLTTECHGALEAVGLDPQVGFLHGVRPGRPALALDLIEELRPITDRFVVSSIRRHQLTLDDFRRTPGGGVYLTDAGRGRFLQLWEQHKNRPYSHALLGRDIDRWAIPHVQATLLARRIRGDIAIYPPFVLRD